MTDRKTQLFFRAGWILASLLIIEELFMVRCAVLSIFVSEPQFGKTATGLLIFAPFIITFIYSLMSVFKRNESRSKTFAVGIAALIMSVGGMIVFFFILIYVLAIVLIIGILLSVHGMIKNKITFSYGLICINTAYFLYFIGMYLLIAAESGYLPGSYGFFNMAGTIFSAVFLAFMCIFIVADLVVSAKRQKVKESFAETAEK